MSTEKKVAAGAGSGCLVLFLFCGGCLGLSALVAPSDRATTLQSPAPDQRVADVAASKPASPDPAKSPPADPPPATPVDELISFARECDDLLSELDEAWESQRFDRLDETDSGAAWGVFIRAMNSRIVSMRETGSKFAPMESKMCVGSIAGYLQMLAHDIDAQDRGAFPKYRLYVMQMINERDTYLRTLAPDYVGKHEKPSEAAIAANMEEWLQKQKQEAERRQQAADASLRESMADDAAKEQAKIEASLLNTLSLEDLGIDPSPDAEAEEEPQPELFTWRDKTGKFSVEAEFLGFKSGKVQLRKTDGSEIEVPLDRLAEEDQKFAKDLFKAIRDVESEQKRQERLNGRRR